MSTLLRKVRVSNNKLNGWVEITQEGMVRHSAPVFNVFVGQHFNALVRWMKKLDRQTRAVVVENHQMEFAFFSAI